jgi:hypothetical protein
MASLSGKPVIFLSSTIHDFADLRGALKFWLEESGFEVWLSEYNDMEKSPVSGTYDACFDAIRKADFYVLLIGGRRGSLYSLDQNISVTQQEYRVAYQAFAEQGKPIPIVFVRRSVKEQIDTWVRAERAGPPPFGGDAAFLEAFIKEVTRASEDRGAIGGLGPYPQANWLRSFYDFRDIMDELRPALGLKYDVSLHRVISGIRLEIEATLSSFVGKRQAPGGWLLTIDLRTLILELPQDVRQPMIEYFESHEFNLPFPGHWYMDSLVRDISLDVKNRRHIVLDRQPRNYLAMYLAGGLVDPAGIWLDSAKQALASGALLTYDAPSKSLQETELSIAVAEVIREAEMYASRYRSADPVRVRTLGAIAQANQEDASSLSIPWDDAIFLWGMYHAQVNLFRRLTSIYAFITERKLSPAPEGLLPGSPLGQKMDEQIKKEQSTQQDIRAWTQMPGFWNL